MNASMNIVFLVIVFIPNGEMNSFTNIDFFYGSMNSFTNYNFFFIFVLTSDRVKEE